MAIATTMPDIHTTLEFYGDPVATPLVVVVSIVLRVPFKRYPSSSLRYAHP